MTPSPRDRAFILDCDCSQERDLEYQEDKMRREKNSNGRTAMGKPLKEWTTEGYVVLEPS